MNGLVLVVEDSEVAADTVVRILERAGYATQWAATLQAARDALAAAVPAVVLLDRRLPDGDGLVFGEQLRREQPSMRVVLMSGDPLNEVDAARVDAWVLKPFAVRALVAALSEP